MTTPDQISNLEFWFKADAITGLSDGDPLSNNATLWPDSGPNARHITAFAGTDCPTYGATAGPSGTGLPGVLFDGNGWLKLPAAALAIFANKPGATVYAIVSKTSSSGNSVYIFHASSGAGANPERFSLKHSSSGSSPRPIVASGRRLDTDADATEQVNSAVADSTFYIETAQADWTNNKLLVRVGNTAWNAKTSAFASGGGNSDTTSSVGIDIGGNPGVTPNSLPITLVEIFGYSKAVTGTEDTGLLTYLQDRMTNTAPTVPGAPTGVSAVAGDTDVIVSWTPPASDGGSAITGYTVTGTPSGSATVSGSTTSVTISGLTNGTAYRFTVHATNAVGNSAESSLSNSATPTSSVAPAAFARATTHSGANENDWSITLPSGTAAGNFLLAVGADAKGSANSITEPDDFTLSGDVSTGQYSQDMRAVVGWKQAVAGDANAVKTWLTGWANDAGAILEYSGISASNPLDVTPVVQQSGNGSMPSVTLPHAGCTLIYGIITGSNATITDPPGFTKRVDVTSGVNDSAFPRVVVYGKTVNSSGATAAIPATVAGNSKTVAFLVALRPAVAVNQPPVANAGPAQTVAASAVVTLAGSGSDPDGNPITYSWRQISGTAVTLSSTSVAQPTFTAPATTTTLTFGLTTNDGSLSSPESTVTITVVAVPDAPVQLTAVETQNTVALSWVPPSASNLDHIQIQRQDPSSTFSSAPTPPATVNDGTAVATLLPTATTFTDTNLQPSTDYAYSVFAVDVTGAVSQPATIVVTTPDLVPIWTFLIGTVDIPAGTTTVKLRLAFQAAPAGSAHWVDAVGLFAGLQDTWSRGGISTTGVAIVEYSDDNGVTWATVRGANNLPLATEEFTSVYDYEAPPGGTRLYRAKIQSVVS